MKLRSLSITTKLGVGFGAVLIVVLLSSAVLVLKTLSLGEIERATAQADKAIDLVDKLTGEVAVVRANALKYVISGLDVDLLAYRSARADLDKNLADVDLTLSQGAPPQLAGQVAEIKAVVVDGYIDRFLGEQVRLALDPASKAAATASVVSSASVTARKAYQEKVAAFREDIAKWSEGSQAQAASAMFFTEVVVIAAGLSTLLVGLVMAWLISKAISRPLVSMTATMRALAKGDHTVEVPARDQADEIGQMAGAVQVFKDAAIEKVRLETEAVAARETAQAERERIEAEKAIAAKQQAQVVENIAQGLNKLAGGDLLQRLDQPFAAEYESLRRDFNAAVVQLQQTIKEVSASSGTIQSGTGEISTASDDLSRRTEQQAANLEETAAALAEITGAMKRASEGAQHAREVVGHAQATADKSTEVIGRTVAAMSRIEQASRQISNIIGVIDEIAFQTNLLALNAGVEAARAGESGRGFAVVASEVRGLAQRCAEAAKEVKTLVLSSEDQVKEGVELVGASGNMLSQIVGQVGELRTIVNDIAASAETQAAGISEVNVAIAQLDQVTQQNAAMAEEATAAARNLAKEGTELLRLVGHFSTGASVASVASAMPRVVQETTPSRRPAAVVPAKRVASGGGGSAAATATAEDWQEF